MEGDDEFGDLYADVLLPFASTSSSAPHPPQSSAASPSSTRLFDLNLQTDNEEIIHGASYANSAVPHQSSDQTTSPNQGNSVKESILAATSNSMQMESVEGARILECGHTKPVEGAKILELGDAELADRALPDMNHDKESGIDDVGSELAVKGDGSIDKDVKFDIEEVGEGLEDVSSDPIIPGLSSGGVVVVAEAGEEEADDWDSDSEDDLPIVLCDNNHMKVERGGMAGDDEEEDEDSELVIVADSDPNQAVEEQEWGENTAQTADGERKDMAELAKASGGVTMVPKVGYSSHGYHPFHSQFKVSVRSPMLLERQLLVFGVSHLPILQ